MRLKPLFEYAIQPAVYLKNMYDLLLTSNQRDVRREWADRFFKSRLVQWPVRDRIWRSRNSHVLMVGNRRLADISEKDFTSDRLKPLLQSSLVLALAAVDKVLHEALSNSFYELVKSGKLDRFARVEVSDAYSIAQDARVRRGRGGRIVPRPGNQLKSVILDRLYEESYLSKRRLCDVCSVCKRDKIFQRYSKSVGGSSLEHETKWNYIYKRRNQIAHESDVMRTPRAQSPKGISISASALKVDIEFAERFGRFLASELDRSI